MALEQQSEHYIAQGLKRKTNELDITIPKPDDFKSLPVKGLKWTVEGMAMKVVGPNYLKEKRISIPSAEDDFLGTVVYLLIKDKVVEQFSFEDRVRESSKEAIDTLKKMASRTCY